MDNVIVPRIKGREITFANGESYVVPPLSLAAVETMQSRLSTFSGDMKDVGLVIDALAAALKRNYPDMTRDQVGDLVDLGNMTDVMMAVMNVSGIQRRESSAGEAMPGAKD